MKEGTPARIVKDRRVWLYREPYPSKSLGEAGRLITDEGKEKFAAVADFGPLCADCTDKVVDSYGNIRANAKLPKECATCDALRTGDVTPKEVTSPRRRSKKAPPADQPVGGADDAPQEAAVEPDKEKEMATATKARSKSKAKAKSNGKASRVHATARPRSTGQMQAVLDGLEKKGVAKLAVRVHPAGGTNRQVLYNAASQLGVKITTRTEGDFFVAEVVKGKKK